MACLSAAGTAGFSIFAPRVEDVLLGEEAALVSLLPLLSGGEVVSDRAVSGLVALEALDMKLHLEERLSRLELLSVESTRLASSILIPSS